MRQGYLAWLGLVVGATCLATAGHAATPKAEDALRLTPVQKGVEYDRPNPEDAAKCKIYAKKTNGQIGWMVEDANGVMLRRFLDTNGDNIVDQWSYYKDGIEVYRDTDSNFNGKADQYRWFNTAGSRWGIDKREEGTIDYWKAISAEEVSAEVVAALANRDTDRFLRLALTPDELKGLGLGETKQGQVKDKIDRLQAEFAKFSDTQKIVAATTKWVQFSASQPGIVPTGTDGSTADLAVYENVVAVVETDGKHNQLQIGTLLRVGDAWRLIDAPRAVTDGQSDVAGFFFHPAASSAAARATGSAPSEALQKLLSELESLDRTADLADTAEKKAHFNARRADLVEKIADIARSPEEKDMWIKQMADMISAAVQQRDWPEGVKRLEALFTKLREAGRQDLAAYVRFRCITADFGLKMQNATQANFATLQDDWRKAIEKYIADYPKGPDTAEALLQLAIDREYASEIDAAKRLYGQAVTDFPDTPQSRKATGALARLDSVGKTLEFQGHSTTGEMIDLATYRGKVVLLHYWATFSPPCKVDIAELKELVAKYGSSGFTVISVSLDPKLQDVTAYLAGNKLDWPQIFETGGLDSRPANALGILTVPTMILIDQSGKVVNRSVKMTDLEGGIKKLLRGKETAAK